MNKVVLLAINAKYVHSSLSVWVIAAGIAKYARKNHDVNVIEATINQEKPDIVELVAKHTPDVIGISSYIWNAGMLPELLSLLRNRLPEALIVLGGPEASNNINFWLENGADHVLQGEGEYCFPQFLDNITEGKQINNENREYPIDTGLPIDTDHSIDHDDAIAAYYPVNNDLPVDTGYHVDTDLPVNPYSSAYLSALNGRLSYIETSRGCPFQCSFCLSAGSGVKYFPLDFVKKQISTLSHANTKTIKFVDRTFNCKTERACEIFQYIIDLDTKCTFHFEVAADLFDERMLSILEAAPQGRIQFEIGLQSFFEPALEAISRKTNMEKAEQNIRALIDMQNIHMHLDLIAGLPYETMFDFIAGFDRAYLTGAHNLQLGFLKLLHGSALREQAADFGLQYSTTPPYEVTSTPWLSSENFQVLKKVENALQHTYNKGRFLSTLHYVFTVTRIKPFVLMHALGESIPNHGTQLEDYALQVYDFFSRLPGVEMNALQDCMVYDWLGMVKGKNAPAFMKNNDDRRKTLAVSAEKLFGRKIKREEFAILNSGIGVFVDSSDRNPVTGLYRVFICG